MARDSWLWYRDRKYGDELSVDLAPRGALLIQVGLKNDDIQWNSIRLPRRYAAVLARRLAREFAAKPKRRKKEPRA